MDPGYGGLKMARRRLWRQPNSINCLRAIKCVKFITYDAAFSENVSTSGYRKGYIRRLNEQPLAVLVSKVSPCLDPSGKCCVIDAMIVNKY
jgi:hypothetical protein